jgi:hypothetical protein
MSRPGAWSSHGGARRSPRTTEASSRSRSTPCSGSWLSRARACASKAERFREDTFACRSVNLDQRTSRREGERRELAPDDDEVRIPLLRRGHCAVNPPSATKTEPEQYAESSEARKSATRAIYSFVP